MTRSPSPEHPQQIIRITVPMPINIANGAHGSWGGRYAQKSAYWTQLDARQNAGLIPPPPKTPFARCSMRSTMHLGAAMDDDNAMRRHKWVNDWLKTRGYIADDKRTTLKWVAFPEQIITRSGERKIELVLTLV